MFASQRQLVAGQERSGIGIRFAIANNITRHKLARRIHSLVEVIVVTTEEAFVPLVLFESELHFSFAIAVIVAVVIQMFLKKVQNDANMRRLVNYFQLVAREFSDNDRVLIELIDNVEQRYADVAGEDNVVVEIVRQ